MQGAWKVGLLVVIFVGLIVGAYQTLGKSLFKKEVDRYDLLFADATGIAEGTRVLMAGVKIGEVEKVKLDSPLRARVSVTVAKGTGIPLGSGAVVPGSLIGIGDNPIQIVPPAKPATSFAAPGSELLGVRSSPLEGLLPDTAATMEEVNKTLAATRKLIENETLRTGLEKLMVSSEQTISQFGQLAKRVDSLMVNNQGVLEATLSNASLAMAEVKRTTEAVTKLASDPQWKNKIGGLLDNLASTTKKADELMASLNAFMSDPALKESLNSTLKNANQMTETGTKIAANAEVMSKNGITITEKTTELLEKATEIADEAKLLLQKLGKTFDKASGIGGLALGGIEGTLEFGRETKPDRYRTDVEVKLPYKDKKIVLGLWDAFESNKLTLQLSQPVSPQLNVRYGIYASKPGVGVEYQLARGLFLRGDLFDINDPRADLRARYEFGNGFYGYLGVNRLFDRNAATIGIGIRK